MNLDSIAEPKKKKPKGDLDIFASGQTFPQYYIETSRQSIDFTAYYDVYEEPSDSAKVLIDIVEELEEKYKP